MDEVELTAVSPREVVSHPLQKFPDSAPEGEGCDLLPHEGIQR